MSTLESYLHFIIWGEKAPRKRRVLKRHAKRGPARNYKYRAWIRTLPCLACGQQPSEAAHTGTDGGMRQKPSDFTCVPLCSTCHTQGEWAYHRIGRKAFEEAYRVSFPDVVRELNRVWFEYSGRVK